MYGYKWIDLELGTYHTFINDSKGTITKLTKDDFINCKLPDKTKEVNCL